MKTYDGQITSINQLTYNQELDLRYVKNNEISGLLDAFVEDSELSPLTDKFVEINENDYTPNFNNGLNVSGQNLVVNTTAFFSSGLEIKGKLFLNNQEILVRADGVLYSPNIGAGVTPPLT